VQKKNPVNRVSCASAKQVAELFGGLVSTSPIWFDSASGVVSVNTQARRLGCLIFLIGQVAHGRKIQSLLFSLPVHELTDLKQNLTDNGYTSGYLTKKASSIEHYLNAAVEFRLLAKQGSMFSLTNRGQFLTDAVRPDCGHPYPLNQQAKTFFLNVLLRADYFGLAAVVSSLLQGARRLIQIQREHQSQLLCLFNGAARSSADSRLHRMAQDRIINIRNWKKPESYSEHLVSAKLNWLIDLGIVKDISNSTSELVLGQEHEQWLNDFCKIAIPTEAHIAAYTLNYAMVSTPLEARDDEPSICTLLDSAFLRLAHRGTLVKVRCTDVILFLLCFHAHALSRRLRVQEPLFPESVIECNGKSYKLTLASRPTQSFIVCSKSGGK